MAEEVGEKNPEYFSTENDLLAIIIVISSTPISAYPGDDAPTFFGTYRGCKTKENSAPLYLRYLISWNAI